MNIDFGNSFLLGIRSVFSTSQTALVALVLAIVAGAVVVAFIHLWSWLWNTQWSGLVLFLSKVVVFMVVLAVVLISIGILHAQNYVGAVAPSNLRTSLGNSAAWRQAAIHNAYNQIQRLGNGQQLPAPNIGGNRLELHTDQEVKIYCNAVSQRAARAAAQESVIPIAPNELVSPVDEGSGKLPITVTPDNSWASEALEHTVDRWVLAAGAWCTQYLESFLVVSLSGAGGIILVCMVFCASAAWHDIAA